VEYYIKQLSRIEGYDGKGILKKGRKRQRS